jgi:hypothetical protein
VGAILRPNASAGLAIRAAYVLPFATILLLWFLIGTRIILKRLSSIQLSVGNGHLKWTQRTFRWTTEISVQQENVTAVFADGTWYRKALKLKMNGKLYILDDLLEDDRKLLSRELRLRLGIAIAAVDD